VLQRNWYIWYDLANANVTVLATALYVHVLLLHDSVTPPPAGASAADLLVDSSEFCLTRFDLLPEQ
jgi:hypothetical protein